MGCQVLLFFVASIFAHCYPSVNASSLIENDPTPTYHTTGLESFADGETDIGETIAKAMDEVTSEILESIRLIQGLPVDPEEQQDAHRMKRSDEDSSQEEQNDQPRPVVEEEQVQRLSGIRPLFSLCERAVHVSTTVFKGMTVAACLSGGPKPTVRIGYLSLSDMKFTERYRIDELQKPVMTAIFEDGDKLFVLVADSARPDRVKMFEIDETFSRDSLSNQHDPNANHPTAVVVWKPSSDSSYHMAVSSSPDPKRQRSTYNNETSFYTFQKGSYFDFYASVDSFLVRDICPFSESGKDYVVIVNSEASPKIHGTRVDSELFRFDVDNKRWISIQKIKTTGAVDCEVFSMGSSSDGRREIFLAIANQWDRTSHGPNLQVDSVLYKFANERFIPFQCLQTVNATSIKAMNSETETGRFVLAVAHYAGVQMYQYNGWKFVPTAAQLTRGALGRGVTSLTFETLGPEQVLIVSNPLALRESSVVKFEFQVNDVLAKWKRDSLNWCHSARSSNVKQSLDQLENTLKNDVFFVDQSEPIRIRGNLEFNGDIEVTGILSAPSVHNVEENELLDHSMTRELDQLDRMLHQLEQETAATMSMLEKALRLDRPHQVVTGQYVFNNELELSCGSGPVGRSVDSCSFSKITAKTLNGRDISNIADEVIRVDRDLVINRNDFYFKHIEVTNDLNVISNGLINGVNMSQIVTKSGTHVIEAPTFISGPVTSSDISVSGLINGMVMNNNTVLLKRGDQVVNSKLIFKSKEPVTMQALFVKEVNNMNLDEFLSKIVTNDGNHVISGHKKFKSLTINNNLELGTRGTLSGINILDLWNNVLWTDKDQDVRANRVTFTHLSVRGDLNVKTGLINGVRVPNDQMILNRVGKPVVITGAKIFTAPVVRIDHMHVQKSLNGINRIYAAAGIPLTTDWTEQLDILVKNLSQTIPAHKVFAGSIRLGGHSTVQGDINGIDLSELERSVLKHNQSNLMSGIWELEGSVTFRDRVTVRGLVDGVNLTSIYANSLKLSDNVIHSFANSFHFTDLQAAQIRCSRVNDLVLERDLLTKHTDQQVTGAKVFEKGIHVTKDFTITGLLNGLSLQFLNDSLLKSQNQRVWGPKIILGDLHVNNLITSQLNGIDFNDFILLNSSQPQIVSGPKTFRTISVQGDLNVRNLEVNSTVNGIHLSDLIQNTLLYDTPQTVTGLKHFDKIVIPAGSNVDVDTLNGYKLKELMDDAVLIDVPQNITGNKVFKSPEVRFRDLRFSGLFDGVSDAEMRNNWMLQGVDQVIKGDLVFGDMSGRQRRRHEVPVVVVKGNLIITNGTLNGIDLRSLSNNIVKVNEPAVIESPVIFKNKVVSNGDVAVSGRVQGIKLAQDVVRKSAHAQAPIRIFGYKTFKKNVFVNGELNINGYVDGVLLKDLCNNAVRITGDQDIRSPVTVKGSVTVLSNITTGGAVDGVRLQPFANMCVMRSDGEQVVRGRKHFKTLILSAPSIVRGKFGGIDLRHLQESYMSLTRDQVVTTPMVFANGAKFESDVLVAGNLRTRDGRLKVGKSGLDVDLREMDANTLKTHGDQVILSPITFQNNVHFAKNLNLKQNRISGVPFDWLLRRKKERQEIRGPVVFENVNIDQNLDMNPNTRVQGVDVSHVRRSQVPITGHPAIGGSKHFSAIEVDHLIVRGNLNGIRFNDKNILLSSRKADQIISGSLTFGRDVRIMSTLNTSKINNVDLVSLRSQLIQNGIKSNDTIYGGKVFLGKVTADQTWAMNLIDGIKISELDSAVHERKFLEEIRSVESKLAFQESKIRKLDSVLDHQMTCVDYYHVTQTMNGSLVSISSPLKSQMVIRSSIPCAPVEVRESQTRFVAKVGSIFDPQISLNIVMNGKTFVVLLSGPVRDQSEGSMCGIRLSGDNTGRSLLHLLTLNPGAVEVTSVIPLSVSVTSAAIVAINEEEACLLAAGSLSLQSVCIDSSGRVAHSQDLSIGSTVRAAAAVTIESEKETFVAIASADDVKIFVWSPSIRSLDTNMRQKIQLQYQDPSSRPVLHFTRSETSPVFLMIAEPKSKKIRQQQHLIRIFQHETRVASILPFTETKQIVDSAQVLAIDSLIVDSELLVFLLMDDVRIRILRHAGASGLIDSDIIEGRSIFEASALAVVPAANGHSVIVTESGVENVTKVLSPVVRNRA